MCGIAGLIDPKSTADSIEAAVRSMNATLVHRGPDSEGTYVDFPVALGMRRLKIIDLSTGDQPIANETRSVWTIHNGEIYNYRELRESLKKRGHTFRTESDTEVIVHQYEEDGERCVEKFRGMFSIALWDSAKKTLLLARDRFGVKPLFVAAGEGRLAFASEMKALLLFPWVDRSWSPEGIGAYLQLGYIPCPLTAYRGIRKFEQGTTELWSVPASGRPELVSRKKYWEPERKEVRPAPRYEEAAEHLVDLLKESIRLRLRSDVPLGAFLSGGVDSTAVVALMRSCGAQDIKTFSIGFEDERFSELEYAALAAKHLGTDHHTQIVTGADAESVIPLLTSYDEPFADSSAIPTYFVSRLARERVTVSLSGDGGDELFAGYSQHADLAKYRKLSAIPWFVRRPISALGALVRPEGKRGSSFVRRLGLPDEKLFMSLVAYPLEGRYAETMSRELRAFVHSGGGDEDQVWYKTLTAVSDQAGAQIADQRLYLADDILTKVDRSSMFVSLESREPLLDHPLAEFANGLPIGYKIDGERQKKILKDALAPYLPEKVVTRKKMGFGVPLQSWLLGPLASHVKGHVAQHALGLFDARGTAKVLEDMRKDWSIGTYLCWRLLSLSIWADKNRAARPW